MLQHTIEQQSALAGRPAVAACDRVTIAVAPDCARYSLRIAPEGLEAAGRGFGFALPARIGGLARSGERVALCLGPDEWFLLAPESEMQAIADGFAVMAEPHSLVDVSHRETGIEIRGAAATWLLGAVCALDLDRMPAGSGTRTILDKAQVVLIKFADDRYRIEVWQSFATHVWGLLAAAARETALDLP